MINVSADELASIIKQIDAALAHHEAWREVLHRVLICRLPAPASEMGSAPHEHCEFGRWLYSPANAHLRALPAFRTIEALHAGMHAKAHALYELRLGGHVVSLEAFDAYAQVAEAFRDEMAALRARVRYTLDNLDPLTGVFIQRRLIGELESALQRLRDAGEPCGLLLFEVDLKAINHSRGLGAGDAVLCAAIGQVREALASRDRIFRLVAAQFLVCLPGRSVDDVNALARDIRERIRVAVAGTLDDERQTAAIRHAAMALQAGVPVQAQLDEALGRLAVASDREMPASA
ncbi:diguanylate cyclase [Nitrogeniibacter mangrovi]|uniref:Diguanylate cyclase n=1 Tax=Nitrogeniibacter mangrovi TaxID=2016596 RepID=A0A6C1B2A3_9RHOO|nr:diguanylate cyclase [Nitrogeniibacter mangrovi]QID16958.1 diguanylate cyclase [Nitrogeniibacter mangrovi]